MWFLRLSGSWNSCRQTRHAVVEPNGEAAAEAAASRFHLGTNVGGVATVSGGVVSEEMGVADGKMLMVGSSSGRSSISYSPCRLFRMGLVAGQVSLWRGSGRIVS